MATENPNIQDIVGKMAALKAELAKVIVGQQDVIDQTSQKYIQAYEIITGRKFVPAV